MQGRIGVLLTALLLVTAGCYHYVPTGLEATTGTEVRVRVSPEQATRLNEQVGTDGDFIRGRLMDQPDEESILIETLVPGSQPQVYQRVRIPLRDVEGVEARETNGLRTGLLVSGLTAATATIITVGVIAGTNRQEQPPDGIDQNIIRPAFRVYW
jgi:hypothetical protein